MAITFLAFCYRGFARTKSAKKATDNRSVHPLGSIDSSRTSRKKPRHLACLLFAVLWVTATARAQSTPPTTEQLQQQVQQLQKLVQQLQSRVEALEKERGTAATKAPATAASTNQGTPASSTHPAPADASIAAAAPGAPAPVSTASTSSGRAWAIPSFLDGTTLNFTLDGYYEYNFNRPIGQMNQLRAYDLSSNSFSLNQADIVVNHPADAAHGKRIGGRLDLMFGQATETLQGNANNELHPSTWRNVFQAYGTYVAPVGSGLTIDFGK